MWVGDTVYFRSDRNGEFNLFGYDTKSKAIRQLTRHDDFPVLSASAGGGRIVYEQAGRLHVLDPGGATTRALTIGVPADLRETRPRFVKGTRYIRNAALSPSGARAVFEFRGEIVTVPAEKGDTRNLTGTPGAHERSPAWSPDGKQIAYFSDASGEYALHVASQDGKGEPRVLKVAGAGFYRAPIWSPDSQKIAYIDNSQSFYWVDLKSGVSKKVAAQQNYSPLDDLHHAWSPDSKWIAYTVDTQPLSRAIHAYSIEQDKSFPITDGLSEVSEPVFDASGKYLYFFGSTDAGPVRDWFAQSNADMRATRVDLPRRAEERRAVSAREGERRGEGREGREGRGGRAGIGARGAAAGEKPDVQKPAVLPDAPPSKTEPFRIDFADIQYRILDLPVPAGESSNLQVGTAGPRLLPQDARTARRRCSATTSRRGRTRPSWPKPPTTWSRPTARRCCTAPRTNWSIVATTKKVEPSEGRIAADAHRGQDRSARRVDADLRRGVAHQPRLLLRPEHARGGLEGRRATSTRPSSRTSRRAPI